MTTLYTYCIPFDDGAAPNPFWGTCTLVICKPVIRRKAEVGDWIIGTGSVNSPIEDISGQVVYAMKVTQKMTMKEYDSYTNKNLPEKIPDRSNPDWRRWRGDSIYDFSFDPPRQRPKSVHTEKNMKTDLGGRCALLSKEFFYFGDKPQKLPKSLMRIVKQGQGYKGPSNKEYVKSFVNWLYGLGYPPCSLLGKPQQDPFKDEKTGKGCAMITLKDDEADERFENQDV